MNKKEIYKRTMFLIILFVIITTFVVSLTIIFTRDEVHFQNFEKDNPLYLAQKNGNHVCTFSNIYVKNIEIYTFGNGENITLKFTDNMDNEVVDSVDMKAGEIKEVKISKLLTFNNSVIVKVVFNDPIVNNVTVIVKRPGV